MAQMDNTLKKVVDLLSADDEEIQGAAAKILGELQSDRSAVIKALGDATGDKSLSVRCGALEALGKSGRSDALRFILPHLTSLQLGERNRAVSATIALGPGVLPVAVKELKGDEPIVRATLLNILLRFPVIDALPFLLDLIVKAEHEVIDQICDDFRKKLDDVPPKKQKDLAAVVRKWLGKPTVMRQEPAVAAGIRLLGPLRDDSSRAYYLKLLETASTSDRVRRQTLLALSKLDLPEKDHAKIWKIAAKIFKDNKNASVVQAACDFSSRLVLPPASGKQLIGFLDHPDRNVKMLAVRQVGELGISQAAGVLAESLGTSDWRLRDEVFSCLRKLPNAGEELLNHFDGIEDPDLADQASQAILEIGPKVDKIQFKKYFSRAVALRKKDEGRSSSFLNLLSSLDNEAFTEHILKEGKRQIKGGDYNLAANFLGQLRGRAGQTKEAKYLLALARFKLSNKGLHSSERESNRSLTMLSELIDFEGIDVAGMLIKDKDLLDKSEIYYLGFHFVEQMAKTKQAGGKLLKHLIKSAPRSKEAKDARNKVKIAGIDD